MRSVRMSLLLAMAAIGCGGTAEESSTDGKKLRDQAESLMAELEELKSRL